MRALESFFLDAAGAGETLARAGSAGYWMASYGQTIGHFEDDIRRAHRKLTAALATLDAMRAEEQKLAEVNAQMASQDEAA
jgi:hypothetical protein